MDSPAVRENTIHPHPGTADGTPVSRLWRRLRLVLVLGALAGAAVALASCNDEEEAPQIQQANVVAEDFVFRAPAQLSAGLTTFRLENKGKEPHHAQLARLKDGTTLQQLQQATQRDPNQALALLEFAGGPGVQPQGKTGEATVTLRQGQYVMLCFVAGADRVPHLAKGMVQPFQVGAASGAATAKQPKSDVEVVTRDFAFQAPTTLKAGSHVVRVVNNGKEPHEMALIKLQQGKTLQDVFAWEQKPEGPPPFDFAGGFQAIDPAGTGWAKVELAKGGYALLCFVPSPANQGKPHTELGMVLPLTVQ